MSGSELTYVALGLGLVGLMVARLVMYRQKRNKLKNVVFFLLFTAIISKFIKLSVTDYQTNGLYYDLSAIGASLFYTALMQFIAKRIARRKEMNPKRHESGRQPVRHGRVDPTPVRHGETAAQAPVHTPPVTPRPAYKPPVEPTPAPQTPPVAPKPPVRQTLRTCVRCGRNLTGPFCGECGYNHIANELCLLRFVEPETLQITTRRN